MKKKLFWSLLLNFFALAAMAQDSSRTNYLLRLHPRLSALLMESITLGERRQSTSDGCQLTGATSGSVHCLLADSCEPAFAPTCGLVFSGERGLILSDVAALSALTDGQEGARLNSAIAPETAEVSSFDEVLRALRQK